MMFVLYVDVLFFSVENAMLLPESPGSTRVRPSLLEIIKTVAAKKKKTM